MAERHTRAIRCLTLLLACTIAAPAFSIFPQHFDDRVDIGGRKVNIQCRGTGSPTVVIDAGMGMAAVENAAWQGIASRITPLARVCLYDRAGLGASDPAGASIRTSADAAADLSAALREAGVKPPFLLVGHSVGGLHALVFADLYASQVAGVVLVSSSHPDQFDAWRAALPAPAPGEDAEIGKAREYLAKADRTPAMNPEVLDLDQSNRQARRLKSVGAKPVVVVTHSPSWKMVPELPDDVVVRLEAQTQRLQKQFLSLSRRSTQFVAATAGHDLPSEDPELVVRAITAAIESVRSR